MLIELLVYVLLILIQMIMNKKFSTLVASLLLATTVGTGYAQVQKGTISERPDMAYINAIEEGKFYQLTNGTKVLIME